MFVVEGDFDLVGDGFLGGVGDEALAAAQDLHRVGHVAVIDGDLQLTLASSGGVDAEGGEDADVSVLNVRHPDHGGVVGLGYQRRVGHRQSGHGDVHHVAADLDGGELDAKLAAALVDDLVGDVRSFLRTDDADRHVLSLVSGRFKLKHGQLTGVEMPHRLTFKLASLCCAPVALQLGTGRALLGIVALVETALAVRPWRGAAVGLGVTTAAAGALGL